MTGEVIKVYNSLMFNKNIKRKRQPGDHGEIERAENNFKKYKIYSMAIVVAVNTDKYIKLLHIDKHQIDKHQSYFKCRALIPPANLKCLACCVKFPSYVFQEKWSQFVYFLMKLEIAILLPPISIQYTWVLFYFPSSLGLQNRFLPSWKGWGKSFI